MAIWILAFFSGTFALQFMQRLPSLFLLSTSLSLIIFTILILKKIQKFAVKSHKSHKSHFFIFSLKLLSVFLLGLIWVSFNAKQILQWNLPDDLVGKMIPIKGYIDSIPQVEERRMSFDFRLTHLEQQKINNVRIKLQWYQTYKKNHTQVAFPKLRVGEQWQLWVKLKQPRGTLNPGSFDYEKWLFQNRIRALGYIQTINQANVLLTGKLHWYLWRDWFYFMDRMRQSLAEKIKRNEQLSQQVFTPVIAALTLGVRAGMSVQQWQVLRDTGTSHLMAISGLHIGLVSGFIYLITGFLWPYLPRAPLLIAAPVAAASSAWFTACVYSALAGFALSTQRALMMIGAALVALLSRREASLWQTLILSLLLVILWEPFASFSPGFWLSFGALAFIIYGCQGRLNPTGWWWRWGRTQWVVTIGLMPLSLLWFQQAAIFSSLLANAIAIPWVGMIVVPISLLGIISLMIYEPLGQWLLLVAAKLMQLIWPLLEMLAGLPAGLWHQAVPNNLLLILSVLGIIIVLIPYGLPGRFLGIVWLLPLALWKPNPLKYGEISFDLIDVGQGLAALIQTRNHVLVFDTGPRFSETLDAGKGIIVPFLQKYRINKIDTLVISHGDLDHIGGAQAVLQSMPVTQIETTVPEKFAVLPQKFPKPSIKRCLEEQRWEWDGVQFEFLFPSKNPQIKTRRNDSCVLRIANAQINILLPGDIEKQAEKYLLNHNPNALKATILVAPHHGSRSSSIPAFVQQVGALYVLFPVGYQNRYKHPHLEVYQRYLKTGALLLDSSHSGAIHFKMGGKGIEEVVNYRQQQGGFWNAT